jgi:hypothetical protein
MTVTGSAPIPRNLALWKTARDLTRSFQEPCLPLHETEFLTDILNIYLLESHSESAKLDAIISLTAIRGRFVGVDEDGVKDTMYQIERSCLLREMTSRLPTTLPQSSAFRVPRQPAHPQQGSRHVSKPLSNVRASFSLSHTPSC